MTQFFKQWVTAFCLLAATHNPSGWSYLAWIDYRPDLPASLVLLGGFTLSMGYVWYIRTTLQTIGKWGITLLYLFFILILWALADLQVVRLDSEPVVIWSLLIISATVFAVGVSWVELRKTRLQIKRRRKATPLGDEWDF